MRLFAEQEQSQLALYVVDNYGIQAADALFEWRNAGGDFRGAAIDMIRRFGRIPLQGVTAPGSDTDLPPGQPSRQN